MAGDVLEDQIEDVLDVWYGFVGDHPHLIHYFSGPDGADTNYLGRVRKRFHQWIIEHLPPTLRPGIARLPARDRAASHLREEERDRRLLREPKPHQYAVHDRLHLSDNGDHESLPR